MAHFAKLDENNIVIDVVVVDNNELLDTNGVEQEQLGIDFLTAWSGGYTNWKQTSYNGNIRVRYAGIGYLYDSVHDAYIQPKPFPSWVFDENTLDWDAPVPFPENPNPTSEYRWDEATQSWLETPEVTE